MFISKFLETFIVSFSITCGVLIPVLGILLILSFGNIVSKFFKKGR